MPVVVDVAVELYFLLVKSNPRTALKQVHQFNVPNRLFTFLIEQIEQKYSVFDNYNII